MKLFILLTNHEKCNKTLFFNVWNEFKPLMTDMRVLPQGSGNKKDQWQ